MFCDGFPFSADPIQVAIGRDLAVSEELRDTHARFAEMFPGFFGAAPAERPRWLPAVLERLDWHMSATPDVRWTGHLAQLARAALHSAEPPLTRAAVATLARHADTIDPHGGEAVGLLAKSVAADPRTAGPELVSWLDQLERKHVHHPATFDLALRLYRHGFIGIPWAAPEIREPDFAPLLELADHDWQSERLAPARAQKLRRAIAKLGTRRVEAAVNRTLDLLETEQPAPMNGAGMTLMRQLLLWLRVEPELGAETPLERLCRVRWHSSVTGIGLMKEWLGTLLGTIAVRRPANRIRCAELLRRNPSTRDFAGVEKLYEQLMAEAMAGAGMPTTGPDGFTSTSEAHEILHSVLAAGAASAGAGMASWTPATRTHLQLALGRAAADLPAFLAALNERVHWLAPRTPRQDPHAMPWLTWRCDLGQLYHGVLEQRPVLSAAELAGLCRADASGWLGIRFTHPLLQMIEAHLGQHGYCPELTGALREWEKSLHGGGATTQALRKRIGQLAWFDPHAASPKDSCWSSVIRRDLAAMAPASRAAWEAALANVPQAIVVAPTKKWLKTAPGLLRTAGAAEFRRRICVWFAPFRSGQKLGLSTAGRDMLGALFWYSILAADPEVDEAVRWFGQARWKTKADLGRLGRLIPMWIHTLSERSSPPEALAAIHALHEGGQVELLDKSIVLYEALCGRAGTTPRIAPPPPPASVDPGEMMARVMQGVLASQFGAAAVLEDGLLRVTQAGTGEEYTIGLRDGRIRRRSDGKLVRLEIDWSSPPFSPFRGMIDGPDIANPGEPNYSRAMLCAQVLSGHLPVEVPIVIDET